jgi:hypothetical protein
VALRRVRAKEHSLSLWLSGSPSLLQKESFSFASMRDSNFEFSCYFILLSQATKHGKRPAGAQRFSLTIVQTNTTGGGMLGDKVFRTFLRRIDKCGFHSGSIYCTLE